MTALPITLTNVGSLDSGGLYALLCIHKHSMDIFANALQNQPVLVQYRANDWIPGVVTKHFYDAVCHISFFQPLLVNRSLITLPQALCVPRHRSRVLRGKRHAHACRVPRPRHPSARVGHPFRVLASVPAVLQSLRIADECQHLDPPSRPSACT